MLSFTKTTSCDTKFLIFLKELTRNHIKNTIRRGKEGIKTSRKEPLHIVNLVK
jgi:hypothetical protein